MTHPPSSRSTVLSCVRPRRVSASHVGFAYPRRALSRCARVVCPCGMPGRISTRTRAMAMHLAVAGRSATMTRAATASLSVGGCLGRMMCRRRPPPLLGRARAGVRTTVRRGRPSALGAIAPVAMSASPLRAWTTRNSSRQAGYSPRVSNRPRPMRDGMEPHQPIQTNAGWIGTHALELTQIMMIAYARRAAGIA